MTNKLRTLLLALFIAAPFSVQAAEGDYTIEVLIFTQNSYGDGSLPYDALDPNQTPPAIAQAVQPGAYNGLPFSQLESLPRERYVLSDDATRLSRQGFRVLWHGGWFQNVGTGRNPNVRIASSDGRVDGVIQVDRGRYLHFKPDLLLSRDAAIESAPQRYRVRHSQRMRSNQLHYLDHPHFGMLVMIKSLNRS